MSIVDVLEQSLVEDMYSRKEIRARVIADIGRSDKEFVRKYKKLVRKIVEFANGNYYDSKMKRMFKLKQIQPDKIASEIVISIMTIDSAPIQGIAGQIVNNIGLKGDIFECIRTVAEVIYAGRKSKLYKVYAASEDECMHIESKYNLDEETLQFINRTKYLPPMLCKPMRITHNNSCGYINQSKESLILGSSNYHDKEINLDVINKMNGVEYALDERIISLPEVSKKPLDTLDKKKSFNDRVIASKSVYKELIDKGNKFYFTHRIDKRGRYYCQGYDVSYQGNSYRKAMLMLHKQELITGV